MVDLSDARREIEEIDREMAELFVKRMKCSGDIAAYKKANSIPILDTGREKELIEKNESCIEDSALRPYYRRFLQGILDISKQYQHDVLSKE